MTSDKIFFKYWRMTYSVLSLVIMCSCVQKSHSIYSCRSGPKSFFSLVCSVLIRFVLSAESWPSDIIFPHSPLIKGRNDKNWLCTDRNLPWRVLFTNNRFIASVVTMGVWRGGSSFTTTHQKWDMTLRSNKGWTGTRNKPWSLTQGTAQHKWHMNTVQSLGGLSTVL